MRIGECIISDYGKTCIYENPWKERIFIVLCVKFFEIIYYDIRYKLPELKNNILIDE